MGMFFHDCLGGWASLSRSRALHLAGTLAGQPLKALYRNGFCYADYWVEDTRLVVLNALDAKEKGAEVITRVECVAIDKHPDAPGWIVTLKDMISDAKTKVHAGIVVNATGAWVDKTQRLAGEGFARASVRYIKGSHVIVPRLTKNAYAYTLKNDDGRVVFVLPYEDKYSLIGTTDADYTGDLEEVRIEMDEVEYLCATVSRFFRHAVTPDNVQWTYSGVRPLIDNGSGTAPSAVARGSLFDMQDVGGAVMLSIYGGKLTTARPLAERVGDRIIAILGQGGKAWTEEAPLPGGEGLAVFETFYKTFRREFGWVPEDTAWRMARAYGSRVRDMLRGFKRISDMGEHFGDGVYETEIRYLVNVEWAMTTDDILWRRSKLGLHVSESTEQKIETYLREMMGG